MNKQREQDLQQGQIVIHPKYGRGTVTRGGRNNVAIKFENGGPVGFATDATNDIADLHVL